MIDARIDAKMPNKVIVQRIADILRDYGPIQHNGIMHHLPKTTGISISYISHVLKRLRHFGMAKCIKTGYPKFVWMYIPERGDSPVDEPPEVKDTPKVMLKHMGSYRVRTHDGRQYDRLEFHRHDLTWSNKSIILDMNDISHLAYIPDHAAYKSGSKHLDIYAHPFASIEDCIVPKLKAADLESPKWINPIRARMLADQRIPPQSTVPDSQLKKDFSSPFR